MGLSDIRGFRKMSAAERRRALLAWCGDGTQNEWLETSLTPPIELADAMVEQAVGFMSVPLGFVANVLVNSVAYDVPMATEEPSVIAAASYGCALVARHAGFAVTDPGRLVIGTIYVMDVQPTALERLQSSESRVRTLLAPLLDRMVARGGGLVTLSAGALDADPQVDRSPAELSVLQPQCRERMLKYTLAIDVRDAMGANLVNQCLETLRGPVEEITGGTVLAAILTNRSVSQVVTVRCRLPVGALAGRAATCGQTAVQLARRVVALAELAQIDTDRAVTHNKGIMNGISAVALATANDTRAIEAAAHAWAVSQGRYRGLSRFALDAQQECITAELSVPLPFATVGGAVGVHPTARLGLAVIARGQQPAAAADNAAAPDAPTRLPAATLATVAGAVGLAQNLAALVALAGEGIQQGHMALHDRRLRYAAALGGDDGTVAQVDRAPIAVRVKSVAASAVAALAVAAPAVAAPAVAAPAVAEPRDTVHWQAHPSLALVKYWGKAAGGVNIPATTSIAVTLGGLTSRTSVHFDGSTPTDATDSVSINGTPQPPERFAAFFAAVRREFPARTGVAAGRFATGRFVVASENDFPTAAGLASSASGFAALAGACCDLAGCSDYSVMSRLARIGSGSAARSVFGGFTRFAAGSTVAEPLAPADFWPDLRVIVVMVSDASKPTTSRDAMRLSATTSPFYAAWVESAPSLATMAEQALAARDLEHLGETMRTSYLRMFSTMFSAVPALVFWLPDSVALIRACAELRAEAIGAWETMDAGPQVKILCLASDLAPVETRLRRDFAHLRYVVATVGAAAGRMAVPASGAAADAVDAAPAAADSADRDQP